jgi:hypothetical protein
VQIIFATGDMMAVAQISKHQGPSSSFPCRSCIAPKLQPFNRGGCYIPEIARLRSANDYKHGKVSESIFEPTVFSILPTFHNIYFWNWDELHGIALGVCKQLYLMLTTRINNDKTVYHHKAHIMNPLPRTQLTSYTFDLTRPQLNEIARCMKKSKNLIPASYEGKWEDVTTSIVSMRAIDYLDWVLFCLSSIIIPFFEDRPETAKMLMKFVRAITLMMEWHLTTPLIDEIGR